MLNLDRLKDLDHEWQQIEESYRLDQYNAPINLSQEKEAMLSAFKAGKSYNPHFEYKNPPQFPLQRIYQFIRSCNPEDSVFEKMYYTVAQNELLAIESVLSHSPSVITGHTSLIYGVPDNELIATARSMLSSSSDNLSTSDFQASLSAEEAAIEMRRMLEKLGLARWSARSFSPMNAKVSVERKDRLVKIREDATFTHRDLRRLLVHEIGVHVLRAENGSKQPIGIFSRGLPSYLSTEEGLAVYSEEKAGVIEPTTMRKYAGRVIATVTSLSHSFNDVFRSIASDVGPDIAFEIAARTKRGFRDTSQPGAHTKDIVYLKGYRDVGQHLDKHPDDHEILFVGKLGLDDMELVRGLIEKNILYTPELVPSALFD